MKTSLLLIIIALSLPVSAVLGEDGLVPPIVARGFDELEKNGSLAAMAVWMAGSARELDQDQEVATGRLNHIQGRRGRMIGYEVARVVPLTASTKRIYVAVKYEKGIAWMSFDCYLTGKDWIVERFDFSTNANNVLPPNILGGQ